MDDIGLVCKEPSRTQQKFKDECTVSKIIAKYRLTGVMPDNYYKGTKIFLDCAAVPNLQDYMEMVIKSEEAFMRLPPEIRKRFRNDPRELIDFLGDEGNRGEAEILGLLKPKGEYISRLPSGKIIRVKTGKMDKEEEELKEAKEGVPDTSIT